MCWDCNAASEAPNWTMFDSLKCEWCAARLIQTLGRLNMRQGESPIQHRDRISARRKVVLADSIASGLDEAKIRELVKGPMAIAPAKRKG